MAKAGRASLACSWTWRLPIGINCTQAVLEALKAINVRSKRVEKHLILKLSNVAVEEQRWIAEFFHHFGVMPTQALPLLKGLFLRKKPSARKALASLLVRMGRAGILVLLEGLKHSNKNVRLAATDALEHAKSLRKQIVKALLLRIDDANQVVRMSAVFALSRFGSSASLAIPKLIELMLHSKSNLKTSAAIALERLVKHPAFRNNVSIRAALRKNDRLNSVQYSPRKPYQSLSPKLLEEIKGWVEKKRPMIAASMIDRIGLMGPKALPALPTLLVHLRLSFHHPHTSWILQVSILKVIKKIGAKAAFTIPDVSRYLNPKAPWQSRLVAIKTLGKLGLQALPSLLTFWKTKDSDEKLLLVATLKAFSAQFKLIEPILFRALTHPDTAFHYQAQETLTSMGRLARPTFLKALRDRRHNVRQIALQGLHLIKPQKVVSHTIFIKALEDPHHEVKETALKIVASRIGCHIRYLPRPSRHIPIYVPDKVKPLTLVKRPRSLSLQQRTKLASKLLRLWKTNELQVDAEGIAIQLIRCLRLRGKATLTLLNKKIPNSLDFPLYSSLLLVRSLGPSAVSTLPSLIAALYHTKEAIQQEAIAVLGRLGSKAFPAVHHLVYRFLQIKHSFPKTTAWALGRIGKQASFAIPALEHFALTYTFQDETKRVVQTALRQIRGK